VELVRGEPRMVFFPAFHPEGSWLVTSGPGFVFWPLGRSYASVVRYHAEVAYALLFGPRGEWLASGSNDVTVRLLPLGGAAPGPGKVLFRTPTGAQARDVEVSPRGDRILIGAHSDGTLLVPVAGGAPVPLYGFEGEFVHSVAWSPSGGLVAARGWSGTLQSDAIRVWDAASGEEVAVLHPDEGLEPIPVLRTADIEFIDDRHLLAGNASGLLRWDLEAGGSELLHEGIVLRFAVDADRRRLVLLEQETSTSNGPARAVLLDLTTGEATPLEAHGDRVRSMALDRTGEIVATGDQSGVIRVGPVTGEDPHLLLGHDRSVVRLAFDPRGRWLASSSEDVTIRLWPMPDLSKPPLHTLPRQELIAKLKTLTNLRVVRDPESATGWTLTHDPFPGWGTVPTW
jgi:WD40 repeat protein